jgi:RNA polymerase sigma factor (sigma-70 family)
MTGAATGRQKERPEDSSRANSSDERLISRCLNGDQESWSALIDKYKNLIYSIPIKLGMYQDAGDIFQSVCVELLSELPRIREHRALPKWLMQTCYHKCLHFQRVADRSVELAPEGAASDAALPAGSADELPENMLLQLEQEQMLRDAIDGLPDKCERLVKLLFFELPPRPYETIAQELGLATGSIGAIRARCLAYLKRHLEKKGF